MEERLAELRLSIEKTDIMKALGFDDEEIDIALEKNSRCDAVAMPAPDILRKQYSGVFAPMPDLTPAVFERVLVAARSSREPNRRIKSMLFYSL